jgi:hypothetical protein
LSELRIVVDDPECNLSSVLNEFSVTTQRRKSEITATLLRRRHQRAFAPQLKINFSEFETIS